MIIAVRHPRPAVAPGVCYGQRDVPLADAAGVSARDIQCRLGDTLVQGVVSSPLRRARDVAQPLAAALGVPLTIEPRLQEMDFGSWEGQAWDAVARADLDAWAADLGGYRPGGGECANDVMRRVEAVWREASSRATRQVWVTHAGPIRCLLALSQGRALRETLREEIPYGGIFRLDAPS